ncbi:cytochrome c-550 PedF [Sinimarinibacterium sp. NLF-5-8]|uniref:cytochrome c-550 PedF n=1 Tax=Sinimarinibacterium sp. NLF-5-8 TaxID=2698684 RepID=UPI00137BBC45|nr:cytochrome c-550 PedF [Sinimarinibacterium sp. NLF-5-8]QHS11297.1 cytochrome c-550 PedF [Sinimarinibacterium sp. NLF-5-8]
MNIIPVFSHPLRLARSVAALGLLGCAATVAAHGDVVPHGFDTKDLPAVDANLTVNPYRAEAKLHEHAADIGASAYNQNCARCHGLEGVSGGIAPDLRYLPQGEMGDEYFHGRIAHGVVRNGVTYMPAFEGIFSEEAMWAVRSYLDRIAVDE